ncbi:Glu/Leu/Phe/Val dehydrogenase dimerization domain-containing protein [Paractinoplanes durhamensis]|uniref:Glu/Leu/Phe/Val dehydrogenase dimerization domain-containing protein n=1 Tax=Paractinoplanes durhamensis TaxID=113563 RepID=UPI00363E9B35
MFSHERVIVRRGPESGLPIVVAVHSTARGQAIGGCRMKAYPDWPDGLADALRLSAAMTDKCALAGLPNGGGKTVIALPPGPIDPELRRAALHDAHHDRRAERRLRDRPGRRHRPGRHGRHRRAHRPRLLPPGRAGWQRRLLPATAIGTVAALKAVCAALFGSPDLAGHSFAILGLGRVGAHVAGLLTDAGAKLTVSDIDESRRALAPAATWTSPADCLSAEVDVLVPAALGGVLTPRPSRRCAAGPSPARPTTSSTPRRPPTCCTSAASSGPRTRWSARAASSTPPPSSCATSRNARPGTGWRRSATPWPRCCDPRRSPASRPLRRPPGRSRT